MSGLPDPPQVLSPTCPFCHEPPIMVLAGGHQAFCGSEDCPTITWDTYQSDEEFRRTVTPLDVSVLDPHPREDTPPDGT